MLAADFFTTFFGMADTPKFQPPKVRFPKGTVIVCPHCCNTIAYSKRDIYSGEVIRSSAWESDVDLSGAYMRCPDDNTSYFMNGKLHTIGGWA